ncbi:MAG: bifunctional diaminohydroxyphosphoribosylaminopyrimidine deaminase/5-amino-6-(5-phosphoribosylamino)uracil reductase RibD [Thiolinea sp.]
MATDSRYAFNSADHRYMARALQLAEQGRYTTHPNPRVGCVIVRDGRIVGEGWHQRAGEPHAEVHALRNAGELAVGADVYVTLEPCAHFGRTPPCADALIRAGVRRVVAAMIDPNPQVGGQGLQRLQAAGIETAQGLLEAQARALNPGFISVMQRQRPFVRVKMAMSLDGRTAMASGESVWITGAAARRDVQFWRAQAGAVLTGIDTVLMDRPSLNVRLDAVELGICTAVRQPERVILDSRLRLPLDAPLLKLDGQVRVYTCAGDEAAQQKIEVLRAMGVQVRQFGAGPESSAVPQLELHEVMTALHQDGINEVHVEAGARLSGGLLEQGLVDELIIYMAPHLMGATARPLFQLSLDTMQQRKALDIQDMRAVGQDWRIVARVKAAGDS